MVAGLFLPVVLCDLDAAFLGFELLRRPELRGLPVIVGGSAAGRGVVATCSYEARAFGVRSAMSAAEALRRCPGALFLPVDMPYYARMSEAFFRVVTRDVATAEPVGLDEVYLDCRGQERTFPNTAAFCQRLQRAVQADLGLSVSIGASTGRALAKLACELRAKPGGIALLPGGAPAAALLYDQPAGVLPGIGAAAAARLARFGIRTCGELAAAPDGALTVSLGGRAGAIRDVALGLDDSGLHPSGPPKSLSVDRTYPADLTSAAAMAQGIAALAWELGGRLYAQGYCPRAVTVRWRTPAFRDGSAQRTFARPLTNRLDLRDAALALLASRGPDGPVRLLSVQAGQLEHRPGALLPQDRLELALGHLEAGGHRIVPAALLEPPDSRRG